MKTLDQEKSIIMVFAINIIDQSGEQTEGECKSANRRIISVFHSSSHYNPHMMASFSLFQTL